MMCNMPRGGLFELHSFQATLFCLGAPTFTEAPDGVYQLNPPGLSSPLTCKMEAGDGDHVGSDKRESLVSSEQYGRVKKPGDLAQHSR